MEFNRIGVRVYRGGYIFRNYIYLGYECKSRWINYSLFGIKIKRYGNK
jgi:hypothetical protein